jgi:hypothetical protein
VIRQAETSSLRQRQCTNTTLTLLGPLDTVSATDCSGQRQTQANELI